MNRNDIVIIHGTNYREMAKQVLERADLAAEIGARSRRIALKPNLLAPLSPSQGATTHGELVEGTLEYLQEYGFENITIMESSWVGARTGDSFRKTGYDRICRKYDVPFEDLQKDSWTEYDACGMKIKVCDKAMEAEYVINMPVLKGHCQTTVTCALKNNKGVIPNCEKRRFHTMGLHKPIAHLNTVVRNDFILVDNICGDLDFEEGGNPVEMNRILGLKDPVLCDAFVCETMGYSAENVRYIKMAEQLGVGSTDTAHANLIYLNAPSKETGTIHMTRRVKALADYTAPRDACSACYGSLIHAIDRLHDAGRLKKNLLPVCIGQGYQGQHGKIGVGRCTSCFEKTLEGCPPKASDILAFLSENWE